jgi:hypothetical protein
MDRLNMTIIVQQLHSGLSDKVSPAPHEWGKSQYNHSITAITSLLKMQKQQKPQAAESRG